MKLFVFFVYAPLSHVFSGNTMIFGNRKGKPEKKCRKIGSGEFECDVKRKEKALLAIPKNYQSANEPSLLITETGIFFFHATFTFDYCNQRCVRLYYKVCIAHGMLLTVRFRAENNEPLSVADYSTVLKPLIPVEHP